MGRASLWKKSYRMSKNLPFVILYYTANSLRILNTNDNWHFYNQIRTERNYIFYYHLIMNLVYVAVPDGEYHIWRSDF